MTRAAPAQVVGEPSPDDPRATVLVENAGFEIVEHDGRVWFFDRRSWGPGVAAAVSGGVAGLVAVNAIVFLAALVAGSPIGPWPVLLVELALAAVAGAVCMFAVQLRSRRLSRPRAELAPLAMVDRRDAQAILLDGSGRPIVPVTEVRAGKALQIGSSAPAVVLRIPGRRVLRVFRGSLFGGGIESALEVLRRLGFRV